VLRARVARVRRAHAPLALSVYAPSSPAHAQRHGVTRDGAARHNPPMAHRVLMIEDDLRLGAMVATYLRGAGFEVEQAADGATGLAALDAGRVDLVLLDLMLPDADGLELCRRIRARSDVPIVMVTARGDLADRIVGLELGADDYLPKPFEPRELLARVRAVLRRRVAPGPADATGSAADTMRFGRLEIDRGAREVRVDGSPRPLTSHQFELLVALAGSAGRVLTREQLMERVRGEPLDAFDRSIDVHVGRIRAAIEDDPRHPRRIVTIRGAGYVFPKSQDGA
jgi:two-component system phosphate regulon response regulator OmpR